MQSVTGTSSQTRISINTSTTQVRVTPADRSNIVVVDTSQNKVVISDPSQQESIQRVAPVINSVRVQDTLRQSVITDTNTNTVVVKTGATGPQGPPGSTDLTTDIEVRHITASGNISASGNIHGTSFKIGDATILQGGGNGIDVTLGSAGATGNISLTTHTGTPFKINDNDNIEITGDITASGAISASGQFLGFNFGLDSTDKLQFSNATLQFRLNDASRITHTPTIFRPTSDEGVSLGRSNEKWKELVVNHITASGDISSSGTITSDIIIASSLTLSDSLTSKSFTGSLQGTASFCASATTANNANKILVDANNTGTSFHIPMYNPTAGASEYNDGYYTLKNPLNELIYYNRAANPITNFSQASDYLQVGGAQNTAGGIYLNSTVQVEPFIYSNFNRMYIKADDRFETNNASYPARLEISTYTGSLAATGVPNYISLESTEIQFTGSLKGLTNIPHSETYALGFVNTSGIDARKSYFTSLERTSAALVNDNFGAATFNMPANEYVNRAIVLKDKGTCTDIHVQGFVIVDGQPSFSTHLQLDIYHSTASLTMAATQSLTRATGFQITTDPTLTYQVLNFSGSISNAVDSIGENSMITLAVSNTSPSIDFTGGTVTISAFLTHRYTK